MRDRERERARMIEIVQDRTGRIHVSKNVIRPLPHFHGARVSCAGRLYVFLDGYKKHLYFVPAPSFQSGPEYVRRGPPRFFSSPCAVALDSCTRNKSQIPGPWTSLRLELDRSRASHLVPKRSCPAGERSGRAQPSCGPASIGCIRRWRV